MAMNLNQIDIVIAQGYEDRNTEYKESMNWSDAATKAKVLRAVLAFANTPGGGYLIFGVEDRAGQGKKCVLRGMKQEHLQSFNEDEIKDYVGNYTSPAISFRVLHRQIADKDFVVVRVEESCYCPVMCIKNGPEINGEPCVCGGCIYTRPSSQRPSSCVVRGGHDKATESSANTCNE